METKIVSLADFIRPIGSVYFSSITQSISPVNLFGGTWINSGAININGEIYNVWHRES